MILSLFTACPDFPRPGKREKQTRGISKSIPQFHFHSIVGGPSLGFPQAHPPQFLGGFSWPLMHETALQEQTKPRDIALSAAEE